MASTAAPDQQQERRLAALEDRLAVTARILCSDLEALDTRLRELERAVPLGAAGGLPHAFAPVPALEAAVPCPAPDGRAAAPARGRSYSDVIGGRVLAWAGGAAIVLGIALFLALAVSRGWIGEPARVLLAGAASLALLGGGSRLRARRGRTEAAVAMAGAGVAGLFATLLVAGAVYHLMPVLLALAGALAVGAVATALAIRWAGRPLAGIGLLGALSAPALLGAPAQWPTLAMMLTAASFAMWVAARRRWAWLSLATVALCAPQWAVPMLSEAPGAGVVLAVLVPFAALGIAGAVASARDGEGEVERRAPAAAALALNVVVVAVVGRAALAAAGEPVLACAWLALLAAVHLALGAAPSRTGLAARTRAALLALGVVLCDAALGLALDGVTLAVTWGASAVVLAAATRRAELGGRAAALRELGVGAQVSLALIRALISAPPATLGGGIGGGAAVALAALASSCMASAHLLGDRRSPARGAIAAVGLAAIGYLTAATLEGPALVVAWTAEAGTLLALGGRLERRVARAAGVLYATGATLYTLLAIAPPTALGGEGAPLGGGAICLCSLAALAWRARARLPQGSRERTLAGGAAGGALLYLASLAVATLPQGQVALSALWGAAGVAALVAGLRTDSAPLRNGALALLLATIAKVFLYDLSTLDSLARVASFLVLGLLLLAGAFAYQRLRPAPPPDMRSVHPSQR